MTPIPKPRLVTASSSEPVIKNETVTPTLAAQWLESNHDNRPITDKRVEEYAAVMRAGGWHMNGETIKFDTRGELIDGQHRLWAVWRSGVTLRLSVARNVAIEANKTIDRGRPRSVAEAFRREGTIPEPKRVAVWAAATYVLLTNDTKANSVEQVEKYYNENKVHIDAMLKILPDKGVFKFSSLSAALVFARPKAPAKVDQFARALVSGENLPATSPIYVLREVLISSVGKRSGAGVARDYGVKTLRALQAYLQGQTIPRTKLYATPTAVAFFRGTGK